VVFVTPTDTIQDLFEKYRRFGIHRVYLAEGVANMKPMGILTLPDVLSIFELTLPAPVAESS
jgi:CBS domain-containing protein